jgi:1-acyl-sn-glycerol-3-phosphate acyltransferase
VIPLPGLIAKAYDALNHLLRFVWFAGIVRPVILFAMGVHIRNREGLYQAGPAIIVANHNSHLDAMVLASVFPLSRLDKIRPVAAADYFLRNRWLAWFSMKIIGIVPIRRQRAGNGEDPLAGCTQAIERGDILLLFPEGSRGEPEKPAAFKTGVARLAERFPTVPVVPAFMQGLGKALPRGEWLLVPVICDLVVGEPLYGCGSCREFMAKLEGRMQELAGQVQRTVLE